MEGYLMREILNINKGWKFSKGVSSVPSELPDDWQDVDLPYTWNGDDGQDGGNDYYRGKGYFAKILTKDKMPQGEEIYIQLDGVNSTAEVYFNGKNFVSITADIPLSESSLMILRMKICLLLRQIIHRMIMCIRKLPILLFTVVFTGKSSL